MNTNTYPPNPGTEAKAVLAVADQLADAGASVGEIVALLQYELDRRRAQAWVAKQPFGGVRRIAVAIDKAPSTVSAALNGLYVRPDVLAEVLAYIASRGGLDG